MMPPASFSHENCPPVSTPTTTEESEAANLPEAERALHELAEVFLQQQRVISTSSLDFADSRDPAKNAEVPLLSVEAKYRALVEQIPAVVFMAYLDKGIGE